MHTKLFINLLTMALLCSSFTGAQTKITRHGESSKNVGLPDDMFDLPELATIIAVQDGKLVVDNLLDKKMRPKENESADIQQGDVIMMVNGKRVKSIQDLKEAYTGAAVSSQVKLGIERNAEMSIVSFEKADPGKLPKRRIMINKGGGEGGDIMLVPGTRLLIGSKGKDVVVNDILSDGPSSFKDADVRKGDVLTAVNDAKVGSFKEFSDAYKKVAVGENVTFHTSRKGEHLSFSFKKVEGGQQRIIKREQE